MSAAFTLLSLSGADLTPPPLTDAALVIVDMQNEYLSGPLTLPGAAPAVAAGARLLAAARPDHRRRGPRGRGKGD